MTDNRPKLMNKKLNKCSTKKNIGIEKVVDQILPSMGKGKRVILNPYLLYLQTDCILGTCTDYDIPFEQLNAEPNGKESGRLVI